MNLQESIRRILREDLLNKSKFFLRRINLDEVKKFLPINAEQVHGETKSYEQFKYELTLRAVEAIMWNDYELGWEDLPEQEEIEFVNEVSNMFNKTIKKLYNSYSGRILREEDYSPAGKEIIPNKIVIHKSNPMFRDKIMENGLKVRAGECYKIYVGYGVKCKPAIFATNSTNKRAWFDSTYDDDIWEINTEMIPDVKWYKDRHFESRSKHIVTFQDIPKEAITLKYEGTGSGDVEKWNKDSPNIVRESQIDPYLLRRFHEFDDTFKLVSSNVYPCDFRHPQHYWNYTIERVMEAIYFNFFYENESELNWESLSDEILYLLNRTYYDELVSDWESKCNNNIHEDFSPEFLRRITIIDTLIDATLSSMYPCEYSSEKAFLRGLYDELYWSFIGEDLKIIDYSDIIDFIEENRKEDIYDYWDEYCVRLS